MSAPAAQPRHFNLLTGVADFKTDFLEGIGSKPRAVPSKHLYDYRGSELFEMERRQPEYYVPEVEEEIYRDHATEMASALDARTLLVEPGSGASDKVFALLDSMESPAGYVALDISTDFMKDAVEHLSMRYPELPIFCIAADFFDLDSLPEIVDPISQRRTVFFPGSTIGNFDTAKSKELLRSFAKVAGPAGKLLVGVDMPKEREVLEKAYDDDAGVASRLHLNLLERANRELDADFDVSRFKYETFFNEEESRMEMYLVSLVDQPVSVAGRTFAFEAGDRIHTGYSYKYEPERFQSLAAEAGLESRETWTDGRGYFSTHLLEVPPGTLK